MSVTGRVRVTWLACMSVCVVVLASQAAQAQLLLRDDFDGTGNVDTTVWRLPFGDSEGTFVGRTQFRGDSATDIPQQGIAEATAEDNAVMEVNLDTFSPIDPGNQFLGTDVLTKRNFARAGGISYEARMRLKPTIPGGLVGAGFLYDVTRESPPGTPVRDEIDVELISNQTVGAATQDPFTNVWNDGSFASPGNGAYVDIASFDLTEFHDYRVDWTPSSLQWFVDDNLVRTVTTGVPDDPMQLHFNLWAPDTDFADAYNAALQPAATAGANTTYSLQVDHVEVNRLNTTTSGNLLTNASFEAQAPTDINTATPTTTDEWLYFGNVFWELDDPEMLDPGVPDAAQDGILMAKAFGPFSGGSNASGLLQNVSASPGQEFEASAWVQTPGGDSIQGTNNFNTVQLSFLDENGAVIEDAPFVPTDGHDFPLLDGRDPNMSEDTWVEGVVNAVAPAATAYARVSLFFIQVYYVPGDYNGNGVVDAADYVAWRDTMGAGGDTLLNDPTPGTVDETDFDFWRENFGSTLAVGDGGASWFDDVSLVQLTPSAGSGAGASAVPEPHTSVLLVLGLLGGLLGRGPTSRRS